MHQLLTSRPPDIRTARLVLAAVTPADIDDLAVLFPRRTDAEHAVQDAIGSRVRHGLGAWVARTIDGGDLVGLGGASMPDHSWVYASRIVASRRSDGFADEIEAAARRVVRESDGAGRHRP